MFYIIDSPHDTKGRALQETVARDAMVVRCATSIDRCRGRRAVGSSMGEITVGIYAALSKKFLKAILTIEVGILLQIIGAELVHDDAHHHLRSLGHLTSLQGRGGSTQEDY